MKINYYSYLSKVWLIIACLFTLISGPAEKLMAVNISGHEKLNITCVMNGCIEPSFENENGKLSNGSNSNLFMYYADSDNDGYGDNLNWIESSSLLPPAGYVTDNTDCNDNDTGINPGAVDFCNNIDDNCDGTIDNGLSLTTGAIIGNGSQCVSVVTGSASFSIASVPGASSYVWTVPSTMNILSGQGTTSIFVFWTAAAAHDGINDIISVTPTDGCSSGTTSTLPISINYIAPVRPSSISGPVKICPGNTATYSVQQLSRTSTYLWTVPTGLTITSGEGTNVIEVLADNLYAGGSITCTASNSCGTGPTRSRTLGLNPPNTPSLISGMKNGLCGSSGVIYSIASINAATDYIWTVPAGATIVNGQGTTVLEVDFSSNFTTGSISVFGSNGCGDGPTRVMNLRGAPDNPGPISGDVTICNSQANVQYEVASVPNTTSYSWKVPGGVTITSGQGTKTILVNYGAISATGLQISVKATNDCGTSFSRVLNGISVDPGNCIRLSDTGSQPSFEVYPNPADHISTVRFTGKENSEFQLNLIDISGRLLYTVSGNCSSENNSVNLPASQFSAGVYLVQLRNQDVEKTIKLIIQ